MSIIMGALLALGDVSSVDGRCGYGDSIRRDGAIIFRDEVIEFPPNIKNTDRTATWGIGRIENGPVSHINDQGGHQNTGGFVERTSNAARQINSRPFACFTGKQYGRVESTPLRRRADFLDFGLGVRIKDNIRMYLDIQRGRRAVISGTVSNRQADVVGRSLLPSQRNIWSDPYFQIEPRSVLRSERISGENEGGTVLLQSTDDKPDARATQSQLPERQPRRPLGPSPSTLLGIQIAALTFFLVGGFFVFCEIFESASNAFRIRPGRFLLWGCGFGVCGTIALLFVHYLNSST